MITAQKLELARVDGRIAARFASNAGRTEVARVHETGGFRLRHPRAHDGCEGVILNTGGGLTGGDRATLDFEIARDAAVVLTTQSAEKIYRAEAGETAVSIKLRLDEGAHLDWLPQETILFDAARLDRRLQVDMAESASMFLVEAIVFGRLAKGETSIVGALHDSWRVRRGGKLLLAEELRLDGTMGATLDHPAIGRGARASAVVLYVAAEAEKRLDACRAALGAEGLDAGASAWHGMLVARLAAASPARLRGAILRLMAALRGRAAPRVWQ